MWLFLVTTLLIIAFSVAYLIWGDKLGFELALYVLVLIWVFEILCLGIVKPSCERNFISEYNATKQMVEWKADNSEMNDAMLIKSIIELNAQIEDEKMLLKDPWVGMFGSKKVASYNPIVYNGIE